jgi:hypothetical protein
MDIHDRLSMGIHDSDGPLGRARSQGLNHGALAITSSLIEVKSRSTTDTERRPSRNSAEDIRVITSEEAADRPTIRQAQLGEVHLHLRRPVSREQIEPSSLQATQS